MPKNRRLAGLSMPLMKLHIVPAGQPQNSIARPKRPGKARIAASVDPDQRSTAWSMSAPPPATSPADSQKARTIGASLSPARPKPCTNAPSSVCHSGWKPFVGLTPSKVKKPASELAAMER